MGKLTREIDIRIRRFGWLRILLFVPGVLVGQLTLSTVRGVATDSTGAVVAGAGITLTNLETNAKREVKPTGRAISKSPTCSAERTG